LSENSVNACESLKTSNILFITENMSKFCKFFKNIQFASVLNKTFVPSGVVPKELIAPYGTLLLLLPFALQ